MNTVSISLPDLIPYPLQHPYGIVHQPIRFFDHHVDDAAVVGDAVEGGVDPDPAISRMSHGKGAQAPPSISSWRIASYSKRILVHSLSDCVFWLLLFSLFGSVIAIRSAARAGLDSFGRRVMEEKNNADQYHPWRVCHGSSL